MKVFPAIEFFINIGRTRPLVALNRKACDLPIPCQKGICRRLRLALTFRRVALEYGSRLRQGG